MSEGRICAALAVMTPESGRGPGSDRTPPGIVMEEPWSVDAREMHGVNRRRNPCRIHRGRGLGIMEIDEAPLG